MRGCRGHRGSCAPALPRPFLMETKWGSAHGSGFQCGHLSSQGSSREAGFHLLFMRLAALFLHVPRDDHTGKEKCKQPETQETCKRNKSLAGPPSLWKYMEYSPAFPTSPSEQACPSPANLIKRQSAHNQKCLKEQAINSSHMLDKCPGCKRNGSSAR